MSGRCVVFQPFDNGGRFDKLYDEVLGPAIEEAGLEPYRVDRDYKAEIFMDTLHREIKAATLCLAEITTRRPNVMYELGYAVASDRRVVIICSKESTDPFPADIHHRSIIIYEGASPGDYRKLKDEIVRKIKAWVEELKLVVKATPNAEIAAPDAPSVLDVLIKETAIAAGPGHYTIEPTIFIFLRVSLHSLKRLRVHGWDLAVKVGEHVSVGAFLDYRSTLGFRYVKGTSDMTEPPERWIREDNRIDAKYRNEPLLINQEVEGWVLFTLQSNVTMDDMLGATLEMNVTDGDGGVHPITAKPGIRRKRANLLGLNHPNFIPPPDPVAAVQVPPAVPSPILTGNQVADALLASTNEDGIEVTFSNHKHRRILCLVQQRFDPERGLPVKVSWEDIRMVHDGICAVTEAFYKVGIFIPKDGTLEVAGSGKEAFFRRDTAFWLTSIHGSESLVSWTRNLITDSARLDEGEWELTLRVEVGERYKIVRVRIEVGKDGSTVKN